MTKPKSYMLAVPSQPRDIEEPQLFLDRLHTTGAFQLMSERMEEERSEERRVGKECYS